MHSVPVRHWYVLIDLVWTLQTDVNYPASFLVDGCLKKLNQIKNIDGSHQKQDSHPKDTHPWQTLWYELVLWEHLLSSAFFIHSIDQFWIQCLPYLLTGGHVFIIAIATTLGSDLQCKKFTGNLFFTLVRSSHRIVIWLRYARRTCLYLPLIRDSQFNPQFSATHTYNFINFYAPQNKSNNSRYHTLFRIHIFFKIVLLLKVCGSVCITW